MKYIVLLRGINISGKNKISMLDLKKELEKIGYFNVTTYLNSGNVILESEKNEDTISNNIHDIILNKFNLNIPIFIIAYIELKELVNNAPIWWGTNKKEIYDNIIFIIKPFKIDEVTNELGNLNKEIEQKENYKNNIFWSYNLNNYRKSNWWSKSAQGKVKDMITIRTANTIRKLLEICER